MLQPCVTFNKEYTHEFFTQNTYSLDPDYAPTNRVAAFAKSLEWGEKAIPLGILYEEEKPTLESQLPQLAKQTLVSQPITSRNLSELLAKFR
ncbi:hypothetical protein FJZ40_04215 [Candidatus Shapirobacteria bacterium]|nr:hypothetical protein [Candidatus Shapirobacteria bacterium]